VYKARTPVQAQWNSFNLGELVFPNHVASLVPLLVGLGIGVVMLWRVSASAEPA
jgi:hypothetical protein